MEHVALRKFPFRALDRQFYRNYFLPRLNSLSVTRMSVLQRCKLVDEILESDGTQFSRPNDDLIDTKANLNYSVFADICVICGLSLQRMGVDETFLDVVLLKRRNSIAHGEDTLVGMDELDSLTDRTIAHMRSFKDAIENSVYLKSYQAA
jgi:hypothetical protein